MTRIFFMYYGIVKQYFVLLLIIIDKEEVHLLTQDHMCYKYVGVNSYLIIINI